MLFLNILIVLGAVFTISGGIGLIALNVQPILKKIRVVFTHSLNDLAYDSDKGRKLLQRDSKDLKKSLIFLFIAGLICLGIGIGLIYAPEGKEPLWKIITDGITIHQPESYTDSNGNSYSDCIEIREKTISLNGQKMDNIKDLEKNIKELGSEHTILLIDDFAVSSEYHKVEALLNNCGIKYGRESAEYAKN